MNVSITGGTGTVGVDTVMKFAEGGFGNHIAERETLARAISSKIG